MLWCPVRAELTVEEALRALLPGDGEIQRMNALVDRLGAETFNVREEATRELMKTPLLPPEVIKRGLESGEPEIVSRMGKIVASGGKSGAEAALDRALDLVLKKGGQGHLSRIVRVMESGLRPRVAERAARAAAVTAVREDEELVGKLGGSEEPLMRRMAAAATEKLGGAGTALAKRLLEDEESSVRMRAAIALGNKGEPEGVAVLADYLGSENTVERVRAWKALKGLTGRDFGYVPMATEEERAEAQKEWRAWLDRDDLEIAGRAGETEWTSLFNGRDLTGWTTFRRGVSVVPQTTGWRVQKGVLICPGNGPGDLRSKAAYRDYVLVVQFRGPERMADSGIGIMLLPENERVVPGPGDGGDYLEIQLLPGRSGDLYKIGDFEVEAGGRKLQFSHSRQGVAGDETGKWNVARVEVSDGAVTVFINGKRVNQATGGPKEPGKILLREELHRFEFREVSLLSLADPE